MNELLNQLAERIRYSPTIECDNGYSNDAGEIFPPQPPHPPIAEQDLAYVENQIGFRLPELVRQIALTVADGGFGPNYGVNRLKHPANVPFGPHWEYPMSVESWHRLYQQPNSEDRDCLKAYPRHFIRYCEVGCNISLLVDCTNNSAMMFIDDPNAADAVRPLNESLECWLSNWISSNPWPSERYTLQRPD